MKSEIIDLKDDFYGGVNKMEEEGESIRLGGNIELSGFSTLDNGSMIVLKKIVGNYVRRIEEKCENFEALKLTMKPVHQTENQMKKFELHGKLIDNGHIYPSEAVEHNLFIGVDNCLRKLAHEVGC